MKINVEQITTSADHSFRAYEYAFPAHGHPFHLHEEYEIAVVEGMGGVLYCGADSRAFSSGDLFLFGGHLPHRFIGHPAADMEGDAESRGLVLQFRHDALGADFFRLPENARVRDLLKASGEGLAFRTYGGSCLSCIIAASGVRRLNAFLSLLADLADERESGETEILSPGTPVQRIRSADAQRLSRLLEYIETGYAGETSLDEAAEMLALTRTSFCRYVKRMTGRTFTELLNDYRLTVAAMGLRDASTSISTISAEAGFGSLSYFNARFRARFGMPPREYRRVSAANRSR